MNGYIFDQSFLHSFAEIYHSATVPLSNILKWFFEQYSRPPLVCFPPFNFVKIG